MLTSYVGITQEVDEEEEEKTQVKSFNETIIHY